ncbi:ATP-dependent endonuclease [uncultured Roseobacter sp.]|uniref:ATP-dependent nuclease n=1 Tax=uncultured Roseobacter sp. TaxID=114847 RepID=UPI00262AA11F|nr:AAA family ATPase [uncultured Roseobacter sp.]
MYISRIEIENFRCFGEGDQKFVLPLSPGLTALLGENDSGKTAVIDALRFVFGTRDQEYYRVQDSDFHWPAGSAERQKEIRVCCRLDGLSVKERGAFAEFLTYVDDEGTPDVALYVHWTAKDKSGARSGRRMVFSEVRTGRNGDGPALDVEARELLRSTYLRPLRDAERALSAGRGSRLSEILRSSKEVRDVGEDYDRAVNPTPNIADLSVLGIGDYSSALVGDHEGIRQARNTLNEAYLKPLSFAGDDLQGQISVGKQGDREVRLRQLLERLELELRSEAAPELPANRGLGSNNLLFMACELLLLGSEGIGLPLLLIEEPEAHLHPQRQLRLMQFLTDHSRGSGANLVNEIQIILTTHSPNLASAIPLDSLILINGGKAFTLASGHTQLSPDDYRFLERFLDVTKANLFFARGVMIVEGDAENILLPTLACLIGNDLSAHGVSIVNVGGTGLRRFARIFQRHDAVVDGQIKIPVACLADMDVMPDCAPVIVGKTEPFPAKNERRWRMKSDFADGELDAHRENIRAKASGQFVETFVSNEWTLEYDLAFHGLAAEVWTAAKLAKADESINDPAKATTNVFRVARAAKSSFAQKQADCGSPEELASHVYSLFTNDSKLSKSIAAQYLSEILEWNVARGKYDAAGLSALMPPYVIAAIRHVTGEEQEDPAPNDEDAIASAGQPAGVGGD